MIALARPRCTPEREPYENALDRFEAMRAKMRAISTYRDRLRAQVSGFAAACERCRSCSCGGNHFDDFEILERNLESHLSDVDSTVEKFAEVERRTAGPLAQARGLGLWPLLAVLAVVLAGKAAVVGAEEINQQARDRKALVNQLRDIKERCAKGTIPPADCADWIPKLEASIQSGPFDRLGATAEKMVWFIGGAAVFALVFPSLLRGVRGAS